MKKLFFATLLISITFSCSKQKGQSDENIYPVIPQPVSLEELPGRFVVTPNTTINLSDNSKEIRHVATLLQDMLRNSAGLTLELTEGAVDSGINFIIDESLKGQAGKYTLNITPDKVDLKAADVMGIYYGFQTLRQLFPPEIESLSKVEDVRWSVPATIITDYPRFSYRGMHLDVGRHFFPVDFIKKFIDLLAMHKMNKFHWHLTEDQGWRIEIKKYPKLTEIGAWRDETVIGKNSGEFDGKRYGGFYTQEEVKEIVKYAEERYVTVIPEIELPGHSRAALAAYPELGCGDGPYTVATTWGVHTDVYCPTEETFTFLENVLSEVIELFPSKYIHIGGDECPKVDWEESGYAQQLIKKEGLKDEHELQSYFITRIEKFLNSKGRNIIGWDEILEGGLAPNATVMSWRGIQGGIEAAKAGHDVIMTPTSHCYFDYYQSLSEGEPLAIGGFLPLKKVYSYEPIPSELEGEQTKHVMGAQGNIWTEYMKTSDHVEYMAFPRAIALAEVVWSPAENKNFDDFTKRLTQHLKRLEIYGVNYANHLFDVTSDAKVSESGTLKVTLNSRNSNAEIYYTVDGSEPGINSNKYSGPFDLKMEATIKAKAFLDGESLGRTTSHNFVAHKATGIPMEFGVSPHQNYSEGGPMALTNGKPGSSNRFNDGEWLAWSGEDFSGTIDFDIPQDISKVKMRFYNGEGSWIYLPSEVRIAASADGETYKVEASTGELDKEGTLGYATFNLDLKGVKSIKVEADNFGPIPEGRPGEGSGAWLFVDEVIVQ